MMGYTHPKTFFLCGMFYVFTISAKGKVREMTMTTVGHDKGKVNCLSRHCLW